MRNLFEHLVILGCAFAVVVLLWLFVNKVANPDPGAPPPPLYDAPGKSCYAARVDFLKASTRIVWTCPGKAVIVEYPWRDE
jgi:hypothetical protein